MKSLSLIARLFVASLCFGMVTTAVHAVDFFYVGVPTGDFFDQANWNDQADGLG